MLSALVLALSPLALPANGWVAFEQPAVAGLHRMGCGDDGKASLNEPMEYWGRQTGASAATHDRFRVFVEFRDAHPAALQAYTPDCDIEAAEHATTISVAPAEMVKLLAAWAHESASGSFASRAVATIAHIDHASADGVLAGLAADLDRESASHDAMFWLAQRRGDTGREIVVQHLEDRWPKRHRRQAVMALALSKDSGALAVVRRQARNAEDGEMRAHAVTALGIVKAPGALADLHSIFLADKDRQVRDQAIFALAQLQNPDAATVLAEIARHPEYGEHRRTALFWLANMHGRKSEQVMDALLGDIL